MTKRKPGGIPKQRDLGSDLNSRWFLSILDMSQRLGQSSTYFTTYRSNVAKSYPIGIDPLCLSDTNRCDLELLLLEYLMLATQQKKRSFGDGSQKPLKINC
jgi:hypothetical protein